MMKMVSFTEFENAKLEIIRGVEYHEDTSTTDYGTFSKTYTTQKNGTFYEVTDPNNPGIIEFWSTKHPESRYYDDRTPEEIAQSAGMRVLQQLKNEKKSINDFLDKNRNLPGAVRDALLMRLADLAKHIKLLDGLEAAA